MSSDETYGGPSGANNSTIEYAENAKVSGVSAKKIWTLDSSGNLINPATSDNQTNGSQKTQIVDSNNKTIVPTTPTDIQLSELIPVLRSLITAIANPSYVDKSANAIRNQVQSGTITTVSTVTNMTNLNGNFGSFQADHLQRMDNKVAWATTVRNLIT